MVVIVVETTKMSLKEKRKKMILEKLAEGAKTWSQLEELTTEEDWLSSKHARTIEKQKKRGSLRDLSDLLNELRDPKKGGEVTKIEKFSGKRAVYMLSKDKRTIQELFEKYGKYKSHLEFVILLTQHPKHDLNEEEATSVYGGLIIRALRDFLDILEIVLRCEEKYQFYVWLILQDFIKLFGRLLVACGQTDSKAADSAIKYVKEFLLENARKEVLSSGLVPKEYIRRNKAPDY